MGKAYCKYERDMCEDYKKISGLEEFHCVKRTQVWAFSIKVTYSRWHPEKTCLLLDALDSNRRTVGFSTCPIIFIRHAESTIPTIRKDGPTKD